LGFDAILGHELPKRVLRAAIEKGRIAHAYLFHGPEGVGKRTFALKVAAALQCTGAGGEGCGACSACRKVARGVHPDVLLFRLEAGTEAVGVDQVREVVNEAGLRPFEGHRRIFLLDDAHLMTESAANALLKTLEEPPAGSVLILLAARVPGIPPTVVSRCQPVAFGGIPPALVAGHLVDTEGVEPSEGEWLAAFCEGSIGRALRYLREDWGEVRRDLLDRLASPEAWGLEGADSLRTVARPSGSSTSEARARIRSILDLLTLLLRDVLVLASGAGEADLYNRDRAEELLARAEVIGFERASRMLQTVSEALEWLERNVHVDLLLETLSLRLRRVLAEGGGSR